MLRAEKTTARPAASRAPSKPTVSMRVGGNVGTHSTTDNGESDAQVRFLATDRRAILRGSCLATTTKYDYRKVGQCVITLRAKLRRAVSSIFPNTSTRIFFMSDIIKKLPGQLP